MKDNVCCKIHITFILMWINNIFLIFFIFKIFCLHFFLSISEGQVLKTSQYDFAEEFKIVISSYWIDHHYEISVSLFLEIFPDLKCVLSDISIAISASFCLECTWHMSNIFTFKHLRTMCHTAYNWVLSIYFSSLTILNSNWIISLIYI